MFYSDYSTVLAVSAHIALAVFLTHYVERSRHGLRTVDFSQIVWC